MTANTCRAGLAIAAALLLSLAALPADAREGDLCSGGENGGSECDFDSDCPSGACVEALAICDGGERDSFSCDCPGGACAGSVCQGGSRDGTSCPLQRNCAGGACRYSERICSGGEDQGFFCLADRHCAGFSCTSTGRFCWGGSYFKLPCVDEDDCNDGAGAGVCTTPSEPVERPFLCAAGTRDAQSCTRDSECPGGACIYTQLICDGGDQRDGFLCGADTDCERDHPCLPTQRICSGGPFGAFGCLRDEHCPLGECASVPLFCDGGRFNFLACLVDADCEDGTCVAPACDASSRPQVALTVGGAGDSYNVCTGDSRLYSFPVVVGRAYRVEMEVFSGDADLYVRDRTPVSREEYTYASDSILPFETIAFTAPASGTYFAAVYGYQEAYYEIAVGEASGTAVLRAFPRLVDLDVAPIGTEGEEIVSVENVGARTSAARIEGVRLETTDEGLRDCLDFEFFDGGPGCPQLEDCTVDGDLFGYVELLVRLPRDREECDFAAAAPGAQATARLVVTSTAGTLEIPIAGATASSPWCPGDCDGDQRLTQGDVALGVLGGLRERKVCAILDGNEDATLTVEELVHAAGRGTGSCPP